VTKVGLRKEIQSESRTRGIPLRRDKSNSETKPANAAVRKRKDGMQDP